MRFPTWLRWTTAAIVALVAVYMIPGPRVLGPGPRTWGVPDACAQGVPSMTSQQPPGYNVDRPFFCALSSGQPPKIRTFGFGTAAIAVTSTLPVLVIEAGNTGMYVRVKRLFLGPGTATAGAASAFTLLRTTTASSAGTVVTPTAWDPYVGAVGGGGFGGTIRSASGGAITAGTTAGTALVIPASTGQTGASNGINGNPVPLDDGTFQPLTIPPGAGNGVQITFTGTAGGANLFIGGIITEEPPPQ